MEDSFRKMFLQVLSDFFVTRNIEHDDFDFDKRLIEDYGLTSDQGIEIALVFEKTLNVVFPESINPAVNDEERRGRTVAELLKLSKQYASQE